MKLEMFVAGGTEHQQSKDRERKLGVRIKVGTVPRYSNNNDGEDKWDFRENPVVETGMTTGDSTLSD